METGTSWVKPKNDEEIETYWVNVKKIQLEQFLQYIRCQDIQLICLLVNGRENSVVKGARIKCSETDFEKFYDYEWFLDGGKGPQTK